MPNTAQDPVITREQLYQHWRGHRELTRRTIEAFPDDQLFTFSIGGMRSFGEMAGELLSMAAPTIEGIVHNEWPIMRDRPTTKQSVLKAWDEATARIDELWPQIPPGRFQEVEVAFGQYEGTMGWILGYVIDNEVHHRGQGYVYLRALGIEPPPFWDRPH